MSSDEAKGTKTTIFGRVIHTADEWAAIEGEAAKTRALAQARGREIEALAQTLDTLTRRSHELEQALAEERARSTSVERDHAARLSELRAKAERDAKALAAARELEMREAKAAIAREAERAEAAEQRARALEAKLEALARAHAAKLEAVAKKHAAERDALLDESAANVEALTRKNAATIDALTAEHTAQLEALAKSGAAERDALGAESAASAAALARETAAREDAIRERDALREELLAARAELSSATEASTTLRQTRDELSARLTVLDGEVAKASARAEAARAEARTRCALAGRLVEGIGASLALAFGGGSRIVWRASTDPKRVELRAAELPRVLEALGVGTGGVAFSVEGREGVLRYVDSGGASAPAWALALAEAFLFHETGGEHTASVARDDDGTVTVRFEAIEG